LTTGLEKSCAGWIGRRRSISFVTFVTASRHMKTPRRFGDPLRKNTSGFWKYRIGPYRIICDIQKCVVTVRVVRIGHRKNAYD